MEIPIYQVDAFTDRLFGGNSAAFCPLESWLDDETLQSIAIENNLSETAYIVPEEGGYHLRWFTPALEVDLCGHATLAAAFVHFLENPADEKVDFTSRSGRLTVFKEGDRLRMDFPAKELEPIALPEAIAGWLKEGVVGCFDGMYLVVVLDNEARVAEVTPDLDALVKLNKFGVVITARGDAPEVDFVSRFFAPDAGIIEDPVTGSAHCLLTPYWSKALGKKELEAVQISARRGYLHCIDKGDRVEISGQARLYLKGRIFVKELPEKSPSTMVVKP